MFRTEHGMSSEMMSFYSPKCCGNCGICGFFPCWKSGNETLGIELQSEERQVGHVNVNLDIDIFVISEPKLLKFGIQAHFFKMFGHTKFQLPISCTFKVIKLLVEITKYITKSLITLKAKEIES